MAHGRVREVVEDEESICERASKPLCLHNPSKAAFRCRFNLREDMGSRHPSAGLPSKALFSFRPSTENSQELDGLAGFPYLQSSLYQSPRYTPRPAPTLWIHVRLSVACRSTTCLLSLLRPITARDMSTSQRSGGRFPHRSKLLPNGYRDIGRNCVCRFPK